MILAGFLERHTETLFVGEPTGGSTIHFGDLATITLPNSGLELRVPRYRYQNSWPWDYREWIAPDLPAELESRDFFANRDVVMKAIEEYIANPWRPLTDTLRALIEEGESSAAIRAAYIDHKVAHPDLFGKTTEEAINGLGYELLGEGRVELAVEVFRLNSESYPSSGNTWDSLAEAVLATGDRERAARLYRKSLEVDPGNDNAERMLSELAKNR